MHESKYKLKTTDLVYEANIADLLDEMQLGEIGRKVAEEFEVDLQSRSTWEKRMESSMKLALQVSEAKNFPWVGASNIKFPLVTIAALQYHARAYPTLISGDTPVKCRVIGEDIDGEKSKRAERIEAHMSYQILEEDEDWESEMDKALITQPIIGCAFKKTMFDPIRGMNVSENILAKDLVVNYWTKSLDTSPRVTHILYYSKNDIYERVVRGLWKDVGEERPAVSNLGDNKTLQAAQSKAQGMTPPEALDHSTPYEILEQHRTFDFDGDGYEEPYIIYVRRDTKKVARIVSRYFESSIKRNEDDKILSIKAEQCFTKYPFIPSPDGGFYDLGFGVLLGPLNESINTLINQLVDAGTMSNTAGGFLSRGIKVRGGNYSFAPLEWKHVDTTGDDLRKGIMPLPVREPSQVLFTLLSLLINYGERTGGAVDILVGQSPGQNTPAETTRTMAEEGKKVFNGIFKRTYRSLKQEFRKMYRLNQLHILESEAFVSDANGKGVILNTDYNGDSSDVRPAADPSITSDSLRLTQAMSMREAMTSAPGMYNRYEVEKQFLKALKVPDVDRVLPDPKGPNAIPPTTNPKVEVEKIKAETAKAENELNLKLGLLKMMKEAEVGQAKIHKLEAEAEKLKAETATVGQQTKINEVNTQIALSRERRDGVLGSIETMTKVFQAMKSEPSKGEAIPK
jgi:chaperonin GroES